jgi:hypothetical protein
MRRWTRRILLIFLLAIVLVAIAVQIALSTDYPRRIVLAQVQQQLGLRIEASGMSTGWLGGTTLRDVRISLPLGKSSFLDMPEMSLSHTALIPLAVLRNFELKSIDLKQPTLIVQRDQNGRWNLQDVVELLAKVGGTPEPGTRKRPPRLPRLRLTNGAITIIERNGQKATISPLTVEGDPDGPLAYRYDAKVADRFHAVGEVAPGENWKHQASVFIDPRDWLVPWTANPPTPLLINAKWSGIVDKNVLHGRLLLQEAKYETFTATGRVLVDASAGVTVLTPQGLDITTPLPQVPRVHIASGTVQVDGLKLTARQLRVGAVGGDAQVDGVADIGAKSAEFNGVWLDLALPGNIRHSGNVALKLRTPFPDRPEITGTIVTRGKAPEGQWDAELRIDGAGLSWSDIDWTVRMQRGEWASKFPLTAENFTARVAQRGPVLTLTEVDWPNHQVFASGKYDHRNKSWSLRLRGQETAQATVNFSLDVRGDRERVLLKELMLQAQGAEFKADGTYSMGVPKPVDLRVYLSHSPQSDGTLEDLPIRGACTAEGHLGGTLWAENPNEPKRNLAFTGTLRARDFELLDRRYGDIRGVLEGTINDNNAEFTVNNLKLLGGLWQLNGSYHYNGKSVASEPLRVKVVAQKLAMKDVAELIRAPEMTGEVGGEWIIEIPFPRPRRGAIAARGGFHATNIAAKGFDVDDIVGQSTLENGVFRADPITLRRAEREVTGTATVSIQTTLAQPKRPTLKISTQTWPVRLGGDAIAAVTLDTSLAIDAASQGAVGPINARAAIATTQRAIGEATLEGHVEGRVATLEKILVNAAGGKAEGRAIIDADHPTATTATFTWDKIDGQRLADLLPELATLSGSFSGQATLDPATAERALEPLRLTVGITPVDAKFRAVAVGPMKLSAFLNIGPKFSVERIVLDELPSEHRAREQRERELDERKIKPSDRPLEWNDLRLADGRVRLWGRRNEHESGGVQTHIIADFSDLNVDQIVRSIVLNGKEVPGRATGQLVLHGDPQQRDLLFGEGHVDLTHSDLANIKAFAFLYNAMHIGGAPKTPIGYGSLDLSLQASTLRFESLRYFNRGTEARSDAIEIGDVWHMPHSTVAGYLVGTARPLEGIKLPFLADADKILSVVQSGLTTVKIQGTIENYNVSLGALSEVGEGLRQLIAGDVQATKK